MTTTELAAHEPGIGKVDYVCRNAQEEIVPCGSEGATEPEPMLSHYHGDQIGSTRAITGEPDGGPAPLEGRIVYTAFGERVWSDGAIGTRYQYAGAWGYQSDLYEDASGNLPFVHVGHRWYDPATGRFLQRDPIGIDGGLNVYAYAEGNSVTNVDPYGLTHDVKFDRYFRERDRMKEEERRQLDIVSGIGVTCAAAAWVGGAAWVSGVIRYLPNAKGIEIVCSQNFRLGWHRFKLNGKWVYRPHYHSRLGIGKHRPWE